MPSHPAPENKGGCVFNAFPKKKINNKGSVRVRGGRGPGSVTQQGRHPADCG